MFRVIHIVQSARPECTGICRIISALSQHSRARGYEVAVVFCDDGPLRAKMSQLGIASQVVPWDGTWKDLFGLVALARCLRINRANLVHLHWGGKAVRTVAKLRGRTKVIQHIHARVDEKTGEVEAEIRVPGVDAVVANSRSIARSIMPGTARVIYAGIEVNAKPESLVEHAGPLRIGVLARLMPIKNIAAVISTAAALREKNIPVHVDIAGSGPLLEELRDLSVRLEVADRVRFLGWREDTANLLASWDLLMVTSFDEGFSLSALEAMAEARPVFGFEVGGLTEVVVDGVTGALVPPRDVAALAERISEFAGDRSFLAKMGFAGWKRAQSSFSVDSMVDQTIDLYDELLKGAHATDATQ